MLLYMYLVIVNMYFLSFWKLSSAGHYSRFTIRLIIKFSSIISYIEDGSYVKELCV